MPITSSITQSTENTRLATLSHFDDAGSPAAASYKLGFRPRYVLVNNLTDSIQFVWQEGMTSGHAQQTIAAGTRSAITTGGVTVVGDTIGFPVLQNKQYRVQAIG